MPGLQLRRLAVVLSCFMLCVPPVAATWSIVAVDETTGEVGAAAATCTVGVELILGLVPGRGVVVAQAATNFEARDRARELIAAGASASDVLAAIANEDFNPGGFFSAPWTEQQYGVATLVDGRALAFTGEATPRWRGAHDAAGVSVQGNILRSEAVVGSTLAAFQRTDGPLAHRLITALEAGAAVGGDARCDSDRAALSAFVAVAEKSDTADSPSLYLVAPREFGLLGAAWNKLVPYRPGAKIPGAVRALRKMYEEI